MPQIVKINLIDRLDRKYELNGEQGQLFRKFLLANYIPASSVLLKVNGKITDDHNYLIEASDKIELTMVRAYQLPEYCQMLEIWGKTAFEAPQEGIYTNEILWFNDSGVCDLKKATIPQEEYPQWLENKFVEAVTLKNLIEENDHICLPLSGGRDSLALLYLLERTKNRLPKFSITGVTVAPTVAGVEDLKIASNAIKALGVKDYRILDFQYVKETLKLTDEFNVVMDKALSNKGRGKTISIWHGIMKSCIERFCRQNEISKIAYGYQFEDLISSLLRSNLLGLLFGEAMQKKTFGPFELIFPLWAITKKELTIYLSLIAPNQQSLQSNPTQYDRGDHNRDIHYFLADMLSTLYPGIGYSLFAAHEAFNKRYDVKIKDFVACRNCNATFPEDSLITRERKDLCTTCEYFYQLGVFPAGLVTC